MSSPAPADPVAAARRLAAEVLAPAASRVEADGAVPRSHLDALAAAGLHGLLGPPEHGGLGAGAGTAAAVVEEVAAGDLATAFVWLQHLGVVARLAREAAQRPGPQPLLRDLCAGRVRAGVALQAALRPGPPAVTARRDGDRWVLDGAVPWVTGWGLVDVVLVAARDGDDVRFLLLDAREGPTLHGEPQPLVAVRASLTVELRLAGHRPPATSLVATAPHAELLAGDAAGLRLNGSLALGLALRCAREVGSADLDAGLDAARSRLAAAGPGELPAARAEAAALAWRAAGALAVAAGSGSVLAGSTAERSVREAHFLLVFGSRPSIRAELLARLGTG